MKRGFELNSHYLHAAGLNSCPKVLQIAGFDKYLFKFCNSADERFLRSANRADIGAIIVPNLSIFDGVEHSVSVDNRAICQKVLGNMLASGLPAILHVYLEDDPVHIDWLVEYYRLNPDQVFLATSFDRHRARNRSKYVQALNVLLSVEKQLKRPLRIVVSSILTNIMAVKLASERFPGRVHLVGQSVFQASINGRLLEWRSLYERFEKILIPSIPQGQKLFEINAQRLAEVIHDEVPAFQPLSGEFNLSRGA